MKSSELNINIVDSYFKILKNLSADNKLKLIDKLSKSIKKPQKEKNGSLKALYGAFISEKSADELIQEIRSARTVNSNKEEF